MIASIQSNYLLFLYRHACQARLACHQVSDNWSVCSFLKLLRDKPSGQDLSPNTQVQSKLGLPDPLWSNSDSSSSVSSNSDSSDSSNSDSGNSDSSDSRDSSNSDII